MPPASRHDNVPRTLSSFVGRDSESAEVERLLRKHRLVTITGPGGAGKSRLALHIVDQVRLAAEDAWWVELIDLSDADLVPARIAQTTGANLSPGTDPRTQLASQFTSRPTLLVLDNCEHLAPGLSELMQQFLHSGTQLRILVTSRRPLGSDGEVVWTIPPLGLPQAHIHQISAEELESAASARLFLERARATRPGLVVDAEAASHIAHLCHHLDGMPLALELAAARVRSLDIRRIREELDKALDLLSGTGPVRASRHRTMQASIAWSESLLTSDERVVLRRLAVFASHFTLEDALPVVSGTNLTPGRVMETFDGLVTQSLLMFEEGHTGPPRYRLLEVIRQHAARRLRQAGEDQTLRRLHAEQYADRAAELGARLARAWDEEAFAWLAADTANLELAIRLLCEWSEPGRAARLLWDTQTVWGLAAPAIAAAVIEHLLNREDALDVGSLARLHVAAAVIRADAGSFSAALESVGKALPLAQQACDPIATTRADLYREAIRSSADPVNAEIALTTALERCAEIGDSVGTVFGRFWLAASVSVFQGATSRGVQLLADYLTDDEAMKHPVHAAGTHAMLAKALVERGKITRALAHASAAEAEIDRVANVLGTGAARFRAMSIPGSIAALVRGYAAVLQSEPPLASIDLVASSQRSAADGHGLAAYIYRFVSGLGHLMRGDSQAALDDLGASVPLSAAIGGWFNTSTCIMGALAALAGDDQWGAHEWLAQVDIATVMSPLLRARFRVAEANLALARENPDIAETLAHLELESVVAEEMVWEGAQLLEILSRVALAKGGHRHAVVLAAAAARLRSETGLTLGPSGHMLPFEHDLALAENALGTDQFEDAWRQGSGLGLEGAVAYVRRTRGQRGRPAFGWNSLTPTERQVVTLVAQGLTNPQIGERLLISRETVKTHLRHVFTKLDVHSRVQLAAAAAPPESLRTDPSTQPDVSWGEQPRRAPPN